MFKLIAFIVTGWVIGIFSAMIIQKTITLSMLKDTIVTLWIGLIRRIDDTLSGPDGHYSNTRVMLDFWNIGSFCLLCVCVLRNIKIPAEAYMLMAGGMGVNAFQAVTNKTKEIQAAVANVVKGEPNADQS